MSPTITGENPSSTAPSWVQTIVIGRNPKFTLVRIVVLVLLITGLAKFVFLPVRVTGISMSPTYPDGRVNLVNKLAYVRSKPQRGDVVAIRMAGERVMLLKRIIGLPGETVTLRRGRVFINNQPLQESYLKWRPHPTWYDEWELKEDEYVVYGDNRTMPFSDHTGGRAYEHQIVGKALF